MMTLSIPRRLAPTTIVNWSDASCLYATTRDDSGEGVSTFPGGVVKDAQGRVIARVSYNARVWDNGQENGRGEDRLLYDPTGALPTEALRY